MTFIDRFGGHARDYARFRPVYPPALYTYLAGLVAQRGLAWDCATGSGQAALGLVDHFARVTATDASREQIAAATPHPRIEYRAAPAERSGFAAASVDLVTVAQALHWFDVDAFYTEVRRVVKPGGVLAAWCYGLTRIAPDLDGVVDRYYRDIVGPYWPAERRHVDDQYRSIAFPFEDIAAPAFRMEQRWTLDEFLGYLATWSATQRYRETHGENPLELIRAPLARAWGEDSAPRVVGWPLHLRIGRV